MKSVCSYICVILFCLCDLSMSPQQMMMMMKLFQQFFICLDGCQIWCLLCIIIHVQHSEKNWKKLSSLSMMIIIISIISSPKKNHNLCMMYRWNKMKFFNFLLLLSTLFHFFVWGVITTCMRPLLTLLNVVWLLTTENFNVIYKMYISNV